MATNNSSNNQLGPNSSLVMTSNGAMLLAQQPSFMAYLSTNATGATGDGTTYTVIFDTVVFDKSSSYNNSSGAFSAPVAGVYQFDGAINLAAGTISTSTSFQVKLLTDGGSFYPIQINPNAGTISGGLTQSFSLKANMLGGDIAQVQVTVSGLIAATVAIGGSANYITYFSGALLN